MIEPPLNEIIALDIETTGLNPQVHEIVEIAMVTMKDPQSIVNSYVSLVKPVHPIAPELTQIHGITNEMVANAPGIEPVMKEVSEQMNHRLLIAHNASFDLSFLAFAFYKYNIPYNTSWVLDSLHLSRYIYPRLESYSLTSLAKTLGIPMDQAHRAYDDAVAAGSLVLKALKEHPWQSSNPWEELLEHHIVFQFHDFYPRNVTAEELIDLFPNVQTELILMAMEKKVNLTIEYTNMKGIRSERPIYPSRIFCIRNNYYIYAFCLRTKEWRQFRLDRIQKIVPASE